MGSQDRDHEAVENVPYFAGLPVEFVYGAGEAVVDALAPTLDCEKRFIRPKGARA
jgi:hypothetical protein